MSDFGKSRDGSSVNDRVALARLHPTAFAELIHKRYQPGEMHWRIGDRLRGLEAGHFDRLLLLAPPRHGKSELASVYFVAWWLGRHPEQRVISVSYNDRLASNFGRQVRDLIASPIYQAVFPGVSVAADAAAADQWNIAGRRGGYLSAGVGGTMTGFGADLFVIDDPIKNLEEASSAYQRDRLDEWLRSVALSRLEPGGRMVVVMTRWHQDDLAGRIIRSVEEGRDHWEVLTQPALSLEGAALWPERIDAAALERQRLAMDEQTWAAMYQQQPTSPRGAVFQRDWVHRFPPPRALRGAAVHIAVDTAVKDGEHNDYSAIVVAVLTEEYFLDVREVWRGHVSFMELIEVLVELFRKWVWGRPGAILVEDVASGSSLYQALCGLAPPEMVEYLVPWQPRGSKVERARLVAPWLRNGTVRLPAPSADVPWLYEFEMELFDFPGAPHDDQVDAFVHLLHYLVNYLSEGHDLRMWAQGQEQWA